MYICKDITILVVRHDKYLFPPKQKSKGANFIDNEQIQHR